VDGRAQPLSTERPALTPPPAPRSIALAMASNDEDRPHPTRADEGGHAPVAPTAPAGEDRILAHRVGWIAGVSGGALLVDFRGNTRGPLAARTTVALDPAEALAAVGRRQEAVLAFEDGDPALPLVVGLVQPSAPTMIDLVLEGDSAAVEQTAVAEVDGKRVLIEGEDEVVLRCGAASITLRRNGKIVIRGSYVESHAAGTNRIKGGSVRIN
jgi:Domain of unknown function (DUF6484)